MSKPSLTVALPQVSDASRHLALLVELQKLSQVSGEAGRAADRQIDELRDVIPADLLRCFDHLSDTGHAAVALVSETGACGSCHLKLPVGVAAVVRRGTSEILKCPYCGCFLHSIFPLPTTGRPETSRKRSRPSARSNPAGVQAHKKPGRVTPRIAALKAG